MRSLAVQRKMDILVKSRRFFQDLAFGFHLEMALPLVLLFFHVFICTVGGVAAIISQSENLSAVYCVSLGCLV